MTEIHLNGELRRIDTGLTLAALLEQAGYGGRRVAVEINGEIVPRSLHPSRALSAGDRVEVVHAIGGG